MLPRILVSGSREGCRNYEEAVRASMGEPVSGYCPQVDLTCDGLLLCGGDDVDPARFGQENCGSVGIDALRDEAELRLAAAFLAAGKPILGICRGHQVLNIALGGTLIQDLSDPVRMFHSHDSAAAHDKTHAIRTAEGSVLWRHYGPLAVVNSSHHQAVDRLGEGLMATAWSEGGVVEAAEHKSLPVLGVQFHPERMAFSRRRPDAADGSVLFDWLLRRSAGV